MVIKLTNKYINYLWMNAIHGRIIIFLYFSIIWVKSKAQKNRTQFAIRFKKMILVLI